jgi:hypothetical protein
MSSNDLAVGQKMAVEVVVLDVEVGLLRAAAHVTGLLTAWAVF